MAAEAENGTNEASRGINDGPAEAVPRWLRRLNIFARKGILEVPTTTVTFPTERGGLDRRDHTAGQAATNGRDGPPSRARLVVPCLQDPGAEAAKDKQLCWRSHCGVDLGVILLR